MGALENPGATASKRDPKPGFRAVGEFLLGLGECFGLWAADIRA